MDRSNHHLPSKDFMDELYGELDRDIGHDPGWAFPPTAAYMRGYGSPPRNLGHEEQHRRKELVDRGWY